MVKLISAKCPNCGAELQMPDSLDIGYCTHCGGKVIIDKDRVQVYHSGSVSSLPLCPNCGNTLTDGNRLFTCELCGKQECSFCSRLRTSEIKLFADAKNSDRRIENEDLNLCKECKRNRKVECRSCSWYFGNNKIPGKCSYCLGTGEVKGMLWKKTVCTHCDGTGVCMVCGGTTWVRLI